jgi:hypothetical protein
MSSVSRVAARYLRSSGMLCVTLGVACATYCGHSAASTIVAPVSAFATSNFGPTRNDYSIENTIDQSGLSLKYISGVTDFDSYLAKKPKHTSNADGNEWFSEDFKKSVQPTRSPKVSKKLNSKTKNLSSQMTRGPGYFGNTSVKRSASKADKKNILPESSAINTSAISRAPLLSIIYGFAGPININGFILWNDEFAGLGKTELWSSTDGIAYTLLSTIMPKPSKFAPAGRVVPYLAQVFSFDLTTMLFFKLLVYDCPGPPARESSYRGCGIGEVAFSAAPAGPVDIPPVPSVPLPAAFPLLGSALGFFVWMGRRRKACN